MEEENARKAEEEFFKELDDFELQLPCSTNSFFSDDQKLLDMVEQQYSDWKTEGRVISVPIARIPKIFLPEKQLVEILQDKFKSAQKGEDAEIKLYRLFMDGYFAGDPGMLVFPNFDANLIFKAQVAQVEMDMVLVHPKNGIFVFNVKNQTGKGSSWKKVRKNLKNHVKFLRLLMKYKTDGPEYQSVPITTIFCDFAKERSKFTLLEKQFKKQEDKVIVFGKNELNSCNFTDTWRRKLSEAGVTDTHWIFPLDLIVARLIALASIDSDSALIHEKLQRGVLQTIATKDDLEAQIQSVNSCRQDLTATVVEQSMAETPKGIKRYILWTKEQLNVIAKVYEGVTRINSSGIRLLITGGKGSGKTLLVAALAKIAEKVVKMQVGETNGRVLICEGTFKSIGLVDTLKNAFSETEITVCGYLPSESQLQQVKIFFCDETSPQLYKYFLDNLREDQHCVLFSSDNRPQMEPRVDVLRLSHCLRSTCQIAHFANRFIETVPKNVFLALPTAKLEGEPVDVSFVGADEKPGPFMEDSFVSKSVDAIIQNAKGLIRQNFIIVVPFVKPEFLQEVIKRLEDLQYVCHNEAVPLNTNVSNRKQQEAGSKRKDLPVIFFCDPHKIEGCEFATTLILLDAGVFEAFTGSSYGNPVLTAITRASLKVKIIVKERVIATEDEAKQYLISVQNEKLKSGVDFVRETGANAKPSVLFVGKLPNAPEFQKKVSVDDNFIPDVEGVALYRAQKRSFLHIDDVFLESDFQKLLDFGVRQIFISNKDISCTWQFLFYIATIHCGKRFSLQHSDKLVFTGHAFNPRVMKFQVELNLECLRSQATNSKSRVSSQEFWKNFESVMPVDQPDKWRIWKDKAAELYKIGEITTAITMYECSIKLLKRRIESISPAVEKSELTNDQKIELTKLLCALSKIYTVHASEIVKGTRSQYNFENVHLEEGVMKAFRKTLEAIRLNVDTQSGFDVMRVVISKLRSYSQSGSFNSMLTQMIAEEKTGIEVSRFRHQSKIPFVAKDATFDAEMIKLTSLIADHNSKASTPDKKNEYREKVSFQAKKMSERSLSPILEASADHQPEVEDQFEHLFNVVRLLFEYPVQLAMVSIHWHLPLKKKNEPQGDDVPEECPQVLDLALSQLENAINQLFEFTKQVEGN